MRRQHVRTRWHCRELLPKYPCVLCCVSATQEAAVKWSLLPTSICTVARWRWRTTASTSHCMHNKCFDPCACILSGLLQNIYSLMWPVSSMHLLTTQHLQHNTTLTTQHNTHNTHGLILIMQLTGFKLLGPKNLLTRISKNKSYNCVWCWLLHYPLCKSVCDELFYFHYFSLQLFKIGHFFFSKKTSFQLNNQRFSLSNANWKPHGQCPHIITNQNNTMQLFIQLAADI